MKMKLRILIEDAQYGEGKSLAKFEIEIEIECTAEEATAMANEVIKELGDQSCLALGT